MCKNSQITSKMSNAAWSTDGEILYYPDTTILYEDSGKENI